MKNHHTLQPEAELLLCCAHTHPNTTLTERIRALLLAELDWAYVTEKARHHKIQPLLFWNLRAICPELVPPVTLAQLQEDYYANTWLNHFLSRELLKIVHLFESHGIPTIPYKGLVLAAYIYGGLSLRQSGDLDILVRQRDVLKAKDLLISQGYRSQFQMDDAEEASYLQTQCEYNFVSADNRVAVELHWGIAPRYISPFLDLEQLWERSKPITLAGTTVLSFSPEDLLLVLCAHGTKHCWDRLGWICDVAELIRIYPELDWERVLAQAGPLTSELLLGLFLAHDLLDAALPEIIKSKLRVESRVRSLAARVRQRLFRETDGPFERFTFHLKLRKRLPDKVRYCLNLVTNITPVERGLVPLPTIFSFLHYPLRSIRLIGQYGLSPLKRMLF